MQLSRASIPVSSSHTDNKCVTAAAIAIAPVGVSLK